MANDSTNDPKSQPDKFRDLARELGCDEDEQKFESAVRRLVKAPVKPKAAAPESK